MAHDGNVDDPHTVTFARDLDEVVDIVPRPNGAPGEFIFATTLVDPSRRPGAAMEEYRAGGYFNSGIMFGYRIGADVPMIDTFSMKFPEPGTYQYICGIHEFHRGTVVVKEATDADLPNQEDITRAARLQMQFGMGIVNSLQSLVAQETTVLDVEPGPEGTTRYMVAAGMGTPEAEVLEFFPRNLNIKKGDTVTWVSTRFHAVCSATTAECRCSTRLNGEFVARPLSWRTRASYSPPTRRRAIVFPTIPALRHRRGCRHMNTMGRASEAPG